MPEPVERLQSALTDRYTLERELGRGGMATVYLAHDLRHHRRVALKVLDADLGSFIGRERFQREIEIAARLQHPNIIPLFDSGSSDDLLFYVMPFIEGESLRDRLDRETQLPFDDALAITREVSGALDYAHEQGVVHRDIKPANILLSEGHALVADFGIARAVAAAGGPELTERGLALGTPTYMSPEQASGRAAVDGRTDVYALGCVLYEMLAGQPPFTGPTVQAVLARHLQERPPSLQVVRPTVSSALQRAVEVALAKVPADRYPTGGALVAALEVARTAKERRPWPRRRWTIAAAATVAAAAAVLATWTLWPKAPDLDPRRMVAFPFASNPANDAAAAVDPDAVLSALLVAVDLSEYVKGEDAWPSLDEASRGDPRLLTARAARAVAHRHRAGFAVRGVLVPARDSTRLQLELWDVAADTIALQRYLAFASPSDAWEMGLRAAESLLPTLILNRLVDYSALRDRDKAATASFLQGEQAYRRSQFRLAFMHDSSAVARDSTLALAAMRGAQAASWIFNYQQAKRLIAIALRHQATLPPAYALFAEGLRDYLAAQPDSAIRHFRAAIALQPRWGEAWMALGEVYSHYFPREAPLDSLAEATFAEARRWDPSYTSSLYDLVQFAIRRGDLRRARTLLRAFEAAMPDSLELMPLQLMLRCVGGSLDEADWQRWVERSPRFVVEAARMLTTGGLRQPRCAEAAWRAILAIDTTAGGQWGATLGLQSVLVAEGRFDEVQLLLDTSTFVRVRNRLPLHILDVLGGAPLRAEAAAAAESLRAGYRANPQVAPISLWYLGLWEAQRGASDAVQSLSDSLAARARRAGDSSAACIARSLAAHAVLARGDTATAIARFEGLAPIAQKADLLWSPWASLGPERLVLARLRLARGDLAGAAREATYFDATGAIVLSIFLRASLDIRIRAARAMGRGEEAAALERRLEGLRNSR